MNMINSKMMKEAQKRQKLMDRLTNPGMYQAAQQYQNTLNSLNYPEIILIAHQNKISMNVLEDSAMAQTFQHHQEIMNSLEDTVTTQLFQHHYELINRLTDSGLIQIAQKNKYLIDNLTNSGITRAAKQQELLNETIMATAMPRILDNLNIIEGLFRDTSVLNQINLAESIENIDWKSFDPTESEIEEATEALLTNEAVLYDMKDNKISRILSNTIWYLIILFSFFVGTLDTIVFINDFATEIAMPYIEENYPEKYKKTLDPIAHQLRRVSKEIKSQVPILWLSLIKLTAADPILKVFKYKNRQSKIVGKLPPLTVVTVMKKERNWSYVYYKNPEDGTEVEGWTFTRYLKKIK